MKYKSFRSLFFYSLLCVATCMLTVLLIPNGYSAPYPYPFESCAPDENSGRYVCVQNSISGAVSSGEAFVEYGNCQVVREQRPYNFVPPKGGDDPNDPRLQDPEFKKEYDWVVSQIRSVGCACCHTPTAGVPATKWNIDAPGVFIDQLSTFGLAVFSGSNVNFDELSRFTPEENYGYSMEKTAVPTKDPERFRQFFLDEAERRGISMQELAAQRHFPGGIFTFLKNQKTKSCDESVGLFENRIYWGQRLARYVFIMEKGSENPLGPPSLDTPEGTLWKIRMTPSAAPLTSGITYGNVPTSARQQVPALGAAAPELEVGTTYKLYVLEDLLQPIVNCHFIYER